VNTLFSIPPIFALVSAGAETQPASPRSSEARRSANGRSYGWHGGGEMLNPVSHIISPVCPRLEKFDKLWIA
jgi:hypothetical protein